MKMQDRYRLLNYAQKDYSEKFGIDYEFKKLSKKYLYKLLQQYKHSSMCEWNYCCYGLYKNCWQEPIEKGNWGLTQKRVDERIKYAIDITAKICRKDNRILYCEQSYGIDIIIIARDILHTDFLITFTNYEF